MLEERGNQVNTFDTIQEGKENILDSIVDGLSEETPEKPTTDDKQIGEGSVIKKPNFNIFGNSFSLFYGCYY